MKLVIDGIEFENKADYEAALKDKEIIDSIKKACDLKTVEGIKAAYSMVKSVRFNTELGNAFDDLIFDLYEKVKKGEFKQYFPEKESQLNKKPKKKTEVKPLDSKTKKLVTKELKKQSLIRNVLVVVLLIIAGGSIGYFVKYYMAARAVTEQTEAFTELKDEKYAEVLKNVKQVVKKDYSEEIVIPDILDEYLALYNKNKSLIGWIKIADTIIDYPVMQTADNEFYLKHNFDQKKDANGCIFLDAKCDIILGNDNWILYGHHMQNGKMFSSLGKYANQDFYEEHKIIQFDTIYEKGTYEVMYAFRSRIYNADEIVFKYYQFIDANSEEEFISNMEEMANLSLIETGVTAEYGDKLLTLSTCDYQEDNGRFVVVAKKID